MKIAPLILISALSAWQLPAQAHEPLPDAATDAALLPDQELRQRFAAPLLESTELDGLFLRSPGLVEEKGSEGRDALTDDALYSETDRLFLEQQNSRIQHDMPTEYQAPVLPPGFGTGGAIGRP